MVKSGFVCFVFMGFVLGTLAAQDQRSAEKSHQVVLKYLGTAGWEISDGTTSILIDPYLSRINGPAPPGGGSGHSLAGDTRRAYGWRAEILSYSRARGLFAGISLEGSTIRPDNDANKRIYGEKISAKDIVIAHETHVPPAAEGLISKLNARTPKHKSP